MKKSFNLTTTLFFLSILVFNFIQLQAQNFSSRIAQNDTTLIVNNKTENPKPSFDSKNQLLFQLSGLPLLNLELSYSRKVSPHTFIGLVQGYKIANGKTPYQYYNSGGQLFQSTDPFTQNMLMPFASSYYCGLNAKQVDLLDGPLYFGVEVFGRFTQYDNAVVSWENKINTDFVRIDDSVKVTSRAIGLKTLVGIQAFIPIKNSVKLVLDIYGGIGTRTRKASIYHYSLSQTYNDNPYKPTEYNFSEINKKDYLTFQLGLKLGVAF